MSQVIVSGVRPVHENPIHLLFFFEASKVVWRPLVKACLKCIVTLS